jgi:hypothetical protein
VNKFYKDIHCTCCYKEMENLHHHQWFLPNINCLDVFQEFKKPPLFQSAYKFLIYCLL